MLIAIDKGFPSAYREYYFEIDGEPRYSDFHRVESVPVKFYGIKHYRVSSDGTSRLVHDSVSENYEETMLPKYFTDKAT